MSWIKDLYAQTETLATKQVIKSRIQNVIKAIKAKNDKEEKLVNSAEIRVENSTEIMGEIVDKLFKTWGIGYKGLNNVFLKTVTDNEEAIVNFVANNSEAIMSLSRSIKLLTSDINKQSAMSIFESLKEDAVDYVEEFKKTTVKKAMDDSINPRTVELGKVWGKEKKWLLMDMTDSTNDVIEVTENEYNTFSKAYLKQHSKWDESRSLFVTRQTSCITPAFDTSEFYQSLGMSKEFTDKL